jgi:hypothetical protein
MKPITKLVQDNRAAVKFPKGMEISISANGSGEVVPECNTDPAGKLSNKKNK